MRLELVVPTEDDAIAVRAEHGRTGGDRNDAAGPRPRGVSPKRGARPAFVKAMAVGRSASREGGRSTLLVIRQPMPHVKERLLMHRFVLERGVQPLDPSRRCGQLRDRRKDGFVAGARKSEHFVARGPDCRRAAARNRGCFGFGIDSALEELLQPRVDGWTAESATEERQRAERGKMTLVKDDWIAQRNRPRVVRRRLEYVEQRRRPRTIAAVPVHGGGAIKRDGQHRLSVIGYRLSVVGCRLSVVGCRLSVIGGRFRA